MRHLMCVIVWFSFALLWPTAAKGSARVVPRDTSFFNATVCPGQTWFIAGTVFDSQNPTGNVVLPGASWDGSDSVVVVTLTPAPPVVEMFQQTFCGNQALFLHGQIFDASNPSGNILFPGAAVGGCDSILQVSLAFLQPSTYWLQQTICSTDTIWVNGQAYDQYYYVGSETIIGGAANGCDSTILVDLTVLPAPADTLQMSICPYSTISVNDHTYGLNRPNGTEILANAAENGCDSIVVIQLSFYDSPAPDFLGDATTVNIGDSLCFDAPVLGAGTQLFWSPEATCLSPDCTTACYTFWYTDIVELEVEDIHGCVYTDKVDVRVNNQRPWFAPNVFAPDADTPNNAFYVQSGIAGARLNWVRIYDRWGSVVLEKTDLIPDGQYAVWDGRVNGRLTDTQVFTYAFEIEYPDHFKAVHSGDVLVLR